MADPRPLPQVIPPANAPQAPAEEAFALPAIKLTRRMSIYLGLAILVSLAAALYWYLARENRRANSQQWLSYTQVGSDAANFAEVNKGTVAGRVARLDLARALLGEKGIATLGRNDTAVRNQGITNIEKAREQFLELAKEFAGDKTLSAACTLEAAEAELALVGIPKDATTTEPRGTVLRAAELTREAAKLVGDSTPAGEKLLARAKELEANALALTAAGEELNRRYNVAPVFTAPTSGAPGAPLGGTIPGLPSLPGGAGPITGIPATSPLFPQGPPAAPTPPKPGTPPTNR